MNKSICTHSQTLPENASEVFFSKKNELSQFVATQTKYGEFANVVNPFPLYVGTQTVQHIKCIHDILMKAIYALVNNYLEDEDISNNMPLSEDVRQILSLCQQVEYQIGALRPDYLLDINGQIKICEINARFTTNGILMTDILNKFYLNNNSGIDNMISPYLQYFDITKKIFIVKNKEIGFDIHMFNEYVNNIGKAEFIVPQDLHIQDGILYAKNEICTQIILELHQDELLAMSTEILEKIIINTKYLNDLRTIFVVHDKRFLSLLTNKPLMLKYLTSEEFEILNSAIIPTVLLNEHTIVDVLANKDLWVLKKSLSGKGDGMYLGKNLSYDEFYNVITNLSDIYTAQKFITQQSHQHLVSTENQTIDIIAQLVVGTFISFNGEYLGLGIARGSTNEIINVASGGAIFAVLEENNIDLLQKLNNTISVAQLAPYYKQQKLSNIDTLAQFALIQPLTQDVIRNNPRDLLTSIPSNCYVLASGGTTGNKKIFYRSHTENKRNAQEIANILCKRGINNSDIVINLLGSGNLYAGMLANNLALEYTGSVILPMGNSADFNFVIDTICEFKVTTLYGLPTQLLAIANHVKQTGLTIKIKNVIYGGEVLYLAARDYLQETLGIENFIQIYSATDTGIIGYQCNHLNDNKFHLIDGLNYMEIVDVDNKNILIADNNSGSICITSLNRKLMPLVRYLNGDCAKIISRTSTCLCGSNELVFELNGRDDDKIKVGAIFISLEDIINAIKQVDGLSFYFQVQVSLVNNIDHINIVVEVINDTVDKYILHKKFSEVLKEYKELQVEIESNRVALVDISLVNPKAIQTNPRTGKMKNIIDLRN